jgi:tight adherence protein B
MSAMVLFFVLLLLTFGITVWVLKPSKPESDIERHLREIGGLHAVETSEGTILKGRVLSSIPWINHLLESFPGSANLQLFITQAGSEWTVGTLLLASLILASFIAWASSYFLPHLLFSIAPGAVAGLLPYVFLFLKRRARFRRLEELLPDAIDLMARALRAGHSITSAIEVVSQENSEPLSSEFRVVFEEQKLGLPIREAIVHLVERMPLDDVRFLATAILVQKETGGNLAEVLDKTSTVMRGRLRLKGQLRVYTAQGRITGWVLCILPFIVFSLMEIVNPAYEKKLWTDPLGVDLLYAGLSLMALGIFAIKRIISIKV